MSFNRGGRDFAVVEVDGGLVAVLTSTRLPGEPIDLRHFRIVVHPDWRRRRLGSGLLDLVRSQDGDPTTLQCNCNRSWRAGTAFLGHHGFRTERREKLMQREGPTPEGTKSLVDLAIRPFGSRGDSGAWSALHNRGYRGAPDFVPLTVADADVHHDEPGFRFWFAERDGVPVGFCHATQPSIGTARIDSLVVDPDHRGRGIGRTLLTVALGALAGAGHGTVALGVRADNHPAVSLYESAGFTAIDEMITWWLPRSGSPLASGTD
jgi:mycothiol synthase